MSSFKLQKLKICLDVKAQCLKILMYVPLEVQIDSSQYNIILLTTRNVLFGQIVRNLKPQEI